MFKMFSGYTHRVFLSLCRHRHRVVRDLVRLVRLRLDDERVLAGEVLALDLRAQLPQHVGAVGDADVLDLLGAHHRAHVHLFAVLLHGNARTRQRQMQRPASFDETAQPLKHNISRPNVVTNILNTD